MDRFEESGGAWPALPLDEWKDTYETLHMWMQIVGKIRLARAPRWNQWWHVPFYLTARGMTTSPMPCGRRTFEIRFDFLDHQLEIDVSDGLRRVLPLQPRSVADFYHELTATLEALRLATPIWPHPVEVPHPIPFVEDSIHHTYVPEQAHRFWEITRRLDILFKRFRGRFRGKCSPVHFFWGSFDLAVTRFSGRMAPAQSESDPITAEGYDEECSSFGFWPGSDATGGPLLYAYTAPEPPGMATARILPEEASYSHELREFVLPWDAVRHATDPVAEMLAFAESTYLAGAVRAGWDVAQLAYRKAEPLPGLPPPETRLPGEEAWR